MYRLQRAWRLIFKHRRLLLGIPGLYVSYAFAVTYVAMVLAALYQAPVVAGIAYIVAAAVEAADILPVSRRSRKLSDWRRGLDVRSQWRFMLFVAAMAAGGADGALLVAFAGVGLGASFGIRLIRSPILGLSTDRQVRPLGALDTGADRLMKARAAVRRRDLTELSLQSSVAAAGFILTLPTVVDVAVASAVAAAFVWGLAGLAHAVTAAFRCRQFRPTLLLGDHDAEVIAGFRAYDPEVLCYFNGHRRSLYAVNVWLRTFEESGRRVALIFRHRDVESIETDRLPGIVVSNDSLIEQLITPSTRVALYPANSTLNIHLLRDNRLSHVFIGHGDSDKAGSASPFSRAYDRIWVSGQAGIDRYDAAGVEIPNHRFDVVGRPPLSPALRAIEREMAAAAAGDEGGPTERLIAELAEVDQGASAPTTILYAPTWEGYFEEANYCSLEAMGVDLVTAILEHFPAIRIIFKPHPMSGHRRPGVKSAADEIRALLSATEDYHPSPRIHPEVDLYDWFDLADLLVTDISSVLSDFMMWDRPTAVANPTQLTTAELSDRFPTTRMAYILDPDARLVATVLGSALTHDPLRERRHEARRHFLGDPERDPLEMFREKLTGLYDATQPVGLIREDPI
ncbi:CDP-glycerol glycerophosphotransferase family protein [Actinomycetota bacterium]